MKKITILITAVVLISLLAGCPRTTPNKKVVESIVNTFTTEFRKDQLRYNCYVRGYDYEEKIVEKRTGSDTGKLSGQVITSQEEQAIVCKTATQDKVKYVSDARRIRDDVVSRFIRVIDSNYEQFANDLQNRRSTTNFLGDITELGVGTAVGITNGERALQILGVALTAFRGGRKSIDQNFYERQSTPILITKMDTSRNRVMSAILQKREKFGVDKYSLEDSLGDVIKYFWAGTLTRAFVELSKDSSVQAKEAEEQLLIVEGVEINPIPTLQSQRISDEIAAQRINLSNQFTTAEDLTNSTDKEAAIRKVIAKFETAWTDIETKDDFKTVVASLKLEDEYNATIGKINDSANQPTKREINRLFARFLSLISATDEAAKNTKLREMYLAIIKKANQ